MKSGPKFEWDEDKRQYNLNRHGIDFRDAKGIFDGPTLEDFDYSHSDEEDRYRALGLVGERVIKVIYAMRQDAIRLISAFEASERETQEYFSCFFFDLRAGGDRNDKVELQGGKRDTASRAKLGRRRDRSAR